MQKKPREMEKIILAEDGCLNHRKVPTDITLIRQSLERLQSHSIVGISQRALKSQS